MTEVAKILVIGKSAIPSNYITSPNFFLFIKITPWLLKKIPFLTMTTQIRKKYEIINFSVSSWQVIKRLIWITRISKQGHSYESHFVVIAVYDNYNGINTVRKESEFEVTWWLSLKISIYETGISITFDNIRTLSLHQYIFLTVANNKQL